jgi:hypothetical protein
MEAEGREKEPICPMRGRITGKGSAGEGWKETWRTGVVFIIVWIVVREYTAIRLELVTFGRGYTGTLVPVSVDRVVYIFGIFKIMSNHCENGELGL